MPRQSVETGSVVYTGRGFHQDASEAMRGDIVRGIIELLTNCDDSYADCGAVVGRISVEVEHRRSQSWKVIVRDRAEGMSRDELRDKLVSLGQRTSGFESGLDRRGNFGRGAKDIAAFGDVTFESVKDNRYGRLELHPDGSYSLEPDRSVRRDDRDRMGIPRGNGTVVTVDVSSNTRCHRHENLRQKLARHFQLRDILSDPDRRVDLLNINDGTRDRLTYEYPDLPVVYDVSLSIPDYPEADAHLTVWRLPERSDDPASDTGRPCGILIKGGRAIYDNTLFQYEGNVHAGWFAGRLTCRYIDALAKDYDDRFMRGEQPSTDNPVPIISRRRDGLRAEHPFVAALRQVVEGPLGELVGAEAERARRESGSGESDNTRALLDKLANEVSRLLGEELREIEAEELPTGPEGLPPLLSIVPEQVFAYMGEDRTLTVAARNDDVSVGDEVRIVADPGGVVEVLTPLVQLRAHPRREDVLIGQVRVRPVLDGEVTLISASMPDRTATALVEVKPERVVVDEPVVAPDTLMFEKPSYRVGWQRRKAVTLIAPASFVAEHGEPVQISSSDPGVVVRGPVVELRYDDELDYYRGDVQIEARTLGATAVIYARVDGQEAETAVAVVRKEEGLTVKVQLVADEMGFWRAIRDNVPLESGGELIVIKILGRHPALRRYLGDGLEGQDSPVCRGMIAEVVADFTARWVVTELFRLRRGSEAFDADRFYREHYKRLSRYLPRFQRLLIGDPEIARTAATLAPVPILEVAQ